MAVLGTSEEWQRQTSLLLQARPTTTRITTKYNVPNLESAKYKRPSKRKREPEGEEKDAGVAAPRIPRASLTLKTYDPESGVCLKFKTDKAADVGRLINGLGRLSRHMAAMPQKMDEAVPHDAPGSGQADTVDTVNQPTISSSTTDKAPPQPPSGPGKKKKKGKK